MDEAKPTPDKRIETKYGLGTIRNLSSGCKILLNIVKNPDKVVGVEEVIFDSERVVLEGWLELSKKYGFENVEIPYMRPDETLPINWLKYVNVLINIWKGK